MIIYQFFSSNMMNETATNVNIESFLWKLKWGKECLSLMFREESFSVMQVYGWPERGICIFNFPWCDTVLHTKLIHGCLLPYPCRLLTHKIITQFTVYNLFKLCKLTE
jgi:hypothetical protein